MRTMRLVAVAVLSLALVGVPGFAGGQSAESTRDFIRVANNYSLVSNVTYLTASNWEAKLDVYQPRGLKAPNPVLMYFHGGGWTTGSKENSLLAQLPYLQMGWTVVNVEYRMVNVALAPAAVEDARCALRWIYRNAKEYNFDTTKIVTSGASAGGHLSLTTGMLPASAGMENICPGNRGAGPQNTDELKVAAIVDWYGITDVNELLAGPNMRTFAVAWLGSMLNRDAIAKQVSPLTYVRAGLPPILSIHGDADPTVPYTQKQRLHQALDKVGVEHDLYTIPGGKHGGFTDEETVKIYERVRNFLAKHNLVPASDGKMTTSR
jgi:acetyl esterase/lipase